MNLKPLVDGDILLYEIGFGAETGWRAVTKEPNALPPWSYVEEMLTMRLANIQAIIGTNEKPRVYLTDDKTPTFRYGIAKLKPYKATRKGDKPWHFRNLKAYITGCLDSEVITGIEADDAMAIESTLNPDRTIICSRDKDLRQVPGWMFSWELGHQPSFGPEKIEGLGHVTLREGKPPKLTGQGLSWFYAQTLMGDTVDNIPGLEGTGAVGAYEILTREAEPEQHLSQYERVSAAYLQRYGDDYEQRLLEQGQLCWIVRRFNGSGSPELWAPGLEG